MIMEWFQLLNIPKTLHRYSPFPFSSCQGHWTAFGKLILGVHFLLLQINLSYCSVTDVGLLALASINRLQCMTILHLSGLSPNGLAAALLACRGLTKVKLHASFKPLLPQPVFNHMEARGCALHWRDKAFQVLIFFAFQGTPTTYCQIKCMWISFV